MSHVMRSGGRGVVLAQQTVALMADSAEPRSPPTGAVPVGAVREGRFSAFISYSHRDAPFAKRLHRDLEGYRLPHRLAARSRTGKRLKPIFRDSDELSATYDLTVAVREAIEQAEHLIVVCSPNAAQSPWVGREIELFRALHGDAAILAVLADGEPAQAFPPALRHALDGHTVEPLAADFRRADFRGDGGGRRLAVLRLVAVLAGVRLDELVQRDGQRRVRRTLGWSGGVVAAVLVVGVLTTLTLNARAETERKREQATGLVDHMLTDVRRNLQRTGRLDQLAAVNESAMAYYRGQNLAKLTDDELRQRAKLLHAMGEDDEKRGILAKALAAFEEAHRTTAHLLAKKPNDPQRIFDHAQSEYWVGSVAWAVGDGREARRRFQAYLSLAQRLVENDAHNLDWIREVGYAESNLGMYELRRNGDLPHARRHFVASLARFERVVEARPDDTDAVRDACVELAWLGDVARLTGDLNAARNYRAQEHSRLGRLAKANPDNGQLRFDLLTNELATARIDLADGAPEVALTRLKSGLARASALAVRDPDDQEARFQQRIFELVIADAELSLSHWPRGQIEDISRGLGTCAAGSNSATGRELSAYCLTLRARLAEARGDAREASALRSAALGLIGADIYTSRWGLGLRAQPSSLRGAHS